jgi:hypothetical protein
MNTLSNESVDVSPNGKVGTVGNENMNVVINGKSVVISHRLDDLTVKDWKELERGGLTLKAMAEVSISQIAQLVYQVMKKSSPDLTMEDIDTMSLDTLKAVFVFIQKAVPVDRPT